MLQSGVNLLQSVPQPPYTGFLCHAVAFAKLRKLGSLEFVYLAGKSPLPLRTGAFRDMELFTYIAIAS